MTDTKKEKRARGSSPRGDFELAKSAALATTEDETLRRIEKTRKLRAARLAGSKGESDNKREGHDA